MNIVNNEKLINRNKKISQIILYAALGLLVVGIFWSISNPTSSQVTFSYIILIPAYILVQISIYMTNRWGRSPRPDEILEQSLKGLDDKYTLYNFSTGVPHMLVGPSGIQILKPFHHYGEIRYDTDKEKYVQEGGPNFIGKLFAQESLPNITRENKLLKTDLEKYFKKMSASPFDEPEIINVFYSEKADVNARSAPNLTLHADKLKDSIRKKAKQKNLDQKEIDKFRGMLP